MWSHIKDEGRGIDKSTHKIQPSGIRNLTLPFDMASPVFSPPTFFTTLELGSKPALLDNLIALINDAFARSRIPDPNKWGTAGGYKRFPSRESYLEMLGEEGFVSVIFDDTKIVAVAGAIPWQGGFEKEGAGIEEGWEIKAVAVHGDAQYLRRGLAQRLYASLEQCVIKEERNRILATMDREFEEKFSNRTVTLWIIAAECINGPYWRRRGYQEVRKKTYGPGTWGCLTWGCLMSFEMVVLRRDVDFEIHVR